MLRRLLTLASLGLLPLPQLAAAQVPVACVPPERMRDIVQVAMPGLIKGAGMRCAATLPPGAPLGSGAPAYAARFQAASDQAWPVARGFVEQLAGDKLPTFLDESTLRVVLDQVVGAAVGAQLDAPACVTANRIAVAVQPLPPGNVVDLASVLIEMAAKQKRSALPIPLCPTTAGRP